MSNLITPLGKIHILIDGQDCPYDFEQLEPLPLCTDIAGSYRITISFVPDGKVHKIECSFPPISKEKYEVGPESGEALECQAFYKDGAKLSIGIESDAGYLPDGTRISDRGYDYDSAYLDNGIAYIILPTTQTRQYVFGICWLDECTDDNDIQTWFGADPTLMRNGIVIF